MTQTKAKKFSLADYPILMKKVSKISLVDMERYTVIYDISIVILQHVRNSEDVLYFIWVFGMGENNLVIRTVNLLHSDQKWSPISNLQNIYTSQ